MRPNQSSKLRFNLAPYWLTSSILEIVRKLYIHIVANWSANPRCCTEFTVDDGHFLDTWAALNDHRNKQTLSGVFVGQTLHKFANFAAQHWHPALSSYLDR